MARLYKTDGTSCQITPENGTDFKLEELYRLLNCRTVELVRIPQAGKIAIIDEEEKFSDKAPNYAVTGYLRYHSAIGRDNVIIGDAIVCESRELR